MQKLNRVVYLIIILAIFIVLHNSIIIGLSNIFTLFRENNRPTLEIEALEAKVQNLETELSTYEKSLENLKIYDGSNYVIAKIALRNIYDFYDVLVISTDTKVNKGNAVINEKGLVGIVVESNKLTAKVQLLTSCKPVSVKIGETYGLLDKYDKKNNEFIIHNINNYTNIEVGEEVTTSGLSKIDGGIKIGKVTKTEIVGVENIIHVEPYVDYDNLNYLMVVNK